MEYKKLPEFEMNFIERYLLYNDAPKNFEQLVDYEYRCLKNYNIPIFTTSPYSDCITDGENKKYPSFLPGKSIEQVKDKFSNGEEYLCRQIDIINNNVNINLEVNV